MSSKVCVLIGEGKSEKSFLTSLLTNQLGFEETEGKNCIVFNSVTKKELFWVFPFPSYGITHRGGYRDLYNVNTYIECKPTIINKSYIWGKNPELHYRIITDSDNISNTLMEERREKIHLALKKASVKCQDYKVNFSNIEIESWFLAGLDIKSPLIERGKEKMAEKMISQDIESITCPKEKLNSILSKRIEGDTEAIGRDFGEYLDIKKAKLKSHSFKIFFESLVEDGLI